MDFDLQLEVQAIQSTSNSIQLLQSNMITSTQQTSLTACVHLTVATNFSHMLVWLSLVRRRKSTTWEAVQPDTFARARSKHARSAWAICSSHYRVCITIMLHNVFYESTQIYKKNDSSEKKTWPTVILEHIGYKTRLQGEVRTAHQPRNEK